MILSEIKKYLTKRKRATLGDLALHFDIDPDAMRDMLNHWIRKGSVVKSDLRATCNTTCSRCCNTSAMEIYEWIH